MDTYHDPKNMLPEQRFVEAASLLAKGFLRLTARKRGHISASTTICKSTANSLDTNGDQSVHATVNHENGE